MKFYATAQLGPKQRLTPEGFLVCEAVPIARTGTMVYGEGETPVDAGRDGIARIERIDAEVFRPETLASFEGKPVTLDHPTDFVGPGNWSALAKGVAQNVRRGDGIENDLLLADLLITDAEAIAEVRDGLREVSCGYEADYEQTEPGRGVQRNIVGNHIALVVRGRCGPRCAIGDKEITMAKRTWMDRIRTAFKAKDEAAMEEALEEAKSKDAEEEEEGAEGEGKKTADALALILKRLDATDAAIAAIRAKDADEEETEEEKAEREKAEAVKTGDKAPTADAWQMVRARAEILSPGISLPTFDAAADPKKAHDALCGCKRRALDDAYRTDAGKDAIAPFLTGKTADFAGMTCATLDVVFVGAAELMRASRKRTGDRGSVTTQDFGRTMDVASINKRNAEFWAKRAGL